MNMSETEHRNPDDEGLSLIEIVVAMFILALLSVAFLPLLVQGVRQSAQTATIATATQLANARMDAERAQAQAGTNCTSLANPANLSTTDSRGIPLLVSSPSVTATCPASSTAYPTTVSFSVTVVRTDTGATIVQADTRLYVDSR